mgnify:CR=1 FL=1
MDKRYQIFISSTFKDLEEERRLLTQTILRKGYYPAGMEWFPGIDEEQFDYIKQVIDDSDYYVLILGGLYGSINSDGKSYTEKEYDYALEKGKKIISMVQKNPAITEDDDARKIKFTQFRKKVMDSRLVSFWNNQEELISKFVTNLELTISKFPMQGWIRCNIDICEERLEFIDINSKISSLMIETVKTIHIMASGTSSYIPIVKSLLKINKRKKTTVNIYIYFRLGSEQQRFNYFRNQYDHWWNTLKKEYSKINFHFICVDDFKISFRGVIINREIGLVGFYIRTNGITLGTLEDSIYIDKNTNVGRYILSYCLQCFENQKEYPTLKSCVDNSI